MSQATLSDRPFQNSNLFSGYYLDERLSVREEWECDEEAAAAMDSLQQLYDLEGDLLDSYGEDALIDNWISEVVEILGFGTQVEVTLPDSGGYVDTLLFESDATRREAASVYLDTEETGDLFDRGVGLLEAKQWDADFTRKFSEQRPYINASHQIKHYLDRTPETIQWGILTNGRKWRLYGTTDYETQTYYEVDLPELLERGDLEAFKYFYLFFRPAAFRSIGGTTFFDSVVSESETVAQELGEDLQDNVFTALRVLGRGFVESNDLDIDPENDAELADLKEQSLVLLYRLMFVLYAESRGLIHPEEPGAIEEYEQNFSLDELRLEIHDEIGEVDRGFENAYSDYSTTMWSRLEDLFQLVDEGEESLGIPPYNGGLFDRESHEFLATHEISNRYLAEVIYRISTTENDEGRYVLADYADLDTRHLGSVYEGLLEHQFRIAPEEYAAVSEDGGQVWKPATEVTVADAVETVSAGSLYVVNDEGERKATGAYYTPDYVVTYIVEETVGPLVDAIRDDLREQGFEPGTHEYLGAFYRRVTQLKILDPAMGSGHFLTRATEFLAKQVMDEVRESEGATTFKEQRVRRDIAKECIYGVDLNGMAVELAKLSMWLETLAADQPLAFLDHHLKAGNSLVGSDVTAVLSSDRESTDGQLTLEQALARVRQDTLEHVMDRMQELLEIDNETLDDIKSMEELYDAVRADPFYQRLFEVTNVHTAERFDLDVPEGAYERMAGAIEDDEKWAAIQEEPWFQTAQAMAGEEAFFHWELEYPEVFFDQDGEKREDAGFDAVIGNPPYVRQEQIRKNKPYLKSKYDTYHGVADLYIYFIEKGLSLTDSGGQFGYITSNKFMRANYGRELREFLTKEANIKEIVDFGELPVFDEASTFPAILLLENNVGVDEQKVKTSRIKDLNFSELSQRIEQVSYTVTNTGLEPSGWSLANKQWTKMINRIEEDCTTLEEYVNGDIYYGVKTGLNKAFFINKEKRNELVSNSNEKLIKPLVVGDDVRRYKIRNKNRYLINIQSGWTRKQSGETNEEDAWNWFCKHFPALANHLSNYQKQARERYDSGEFWWELRSCDYEELFEKTKIVYPVIAMSPRFAIDEKDQYLNDKCFMIPKEDYFLLGVLNSKLVFEIAKLKVSVLGDEEAGGRLELRTVHLKNLPLPLIGSEESDTSNVDTTELLEKYLSYIDGNQPLFIPDHDHLKKKYLEIIIEKMIELQSEYSTLNLSLFDHLGISSDELPDSVADDTLGDLQMPVAGLADTPVIKTTEDFDGLRIESVSFQDNGERLVMAVDISYKIDEEDPRETDTWDRLAESEFETYEAMAFAGLSETEKTLIREFVTVAVEEAGGFAGFRQNATKTNSPLDRLKDLTLPDIEQVCDELEQYTEVKARADELDRKIEKTDQLIDEIVYELYGLTDEEIAIVEDAVDQ